MWKNVHGLKYVKQNKINAIFIIFYILHIAQISPPGYVKLLNISVYCILVCKSKCIYLTRFQLLWINLLHFARLFLNQNCIFFCSSLGNFFLQIDIIQPKVPRDVPAAGSPVGQLVESVSVGGHGRVRGVTVLEEPLLQSGNLNTMSHN